MYNFEENPAHGSFDKQNYKVWVAAGTRACCHVSSVQPFWFSTPLSGLLGRCTEPAPPHTCRPQLPPCPASPTPSGQGDAAAVVEAADVRPSQLNHVGAREGGAQQRHAVQDWLAKVPQHAREVRRTTLRVSQCMHACTCYAWVWSKRQRHASGTCIPDVHWRPSCAPPPSAAGGSRWRRCCGRSWT